jgi:hypothetical protein
VMLQTSIVDCLALDPFAFEENGLTAPEVDVGGGEIAQALRGSSVPQVPASVSKVLIPDSPEHRVFPVDPIEL